jgi:integrase
MDERTISHYQILRDIIVRFEKKNKVRLRDITAELMDDFSTFLTQNENYAQKTAKRMVSRFKFFCARAEEENIEVNKNYKQRVFVDARETEYKEPYLNEEEIDRIFKHDFSYNDALDNARDNLIISVWTALRVSDFLGRLRIENIDGDFIDIITKKTGKHVSIPIHSHIKAILKKRNGKFPAKISEQRYNDYLKIIGQIVEIDEEMKGGVIEVDKKTGKKRKVYGTYKKYELMTSHIGRRSFASNLFGKVPNSVIMSVAGWSNESMLLNYIKKTNRQNAESLKEYWEKNNH